MVALTENARKWPEGDAGMPGPDDRLGVSWSGGIIRLVDPRIFRDPTGEACRSFLKRVFRLEEIRSVEIDRAHGSASVHPVGGDVDIDRVIDRMSASLRDEPAAETAPTAGPIAGADLSQPIVRISRYGSILSSWEVVHELPGRIRLRHEGLRKVGPLGERVQGELLAVDGVISCRVNPWTAGLLVRFDPGAIDPHQILRILDHIVEGSALALADRGHPPSVRFGLANASVALAVAGEFAVPALLPASAVLLVASNARTFRVAWREIRTRQVGLPLLTTTIIGVTLASGQFLAATLMGWSFRFWHHRHRERLHATRRAMLPSIAQHRRFARLLVEGAEVEVTLEHLKGGDSIAVRAGEVVPADGRIVEGSAVIDERLIRGGDGATLKRNGDRVSAGTRLASGDLAVVVEAIGDSTRSAHLARAIRSGTTHAPSDHAITAGGEAFARRAVLPTLATAGLSLMVLDLTTAAAVLRPDYATGPGLGVSLEALRDSSLCASEGIIIRDAGAFARLAGADLILFDDGPDLTHFAPVVASVEVEPGTTADEATILRVAEAGLRGLDDERAAALGDAIDARDLDPIEALTEYGGGMAVFHGGKAYAVAEDAGSAGVAAEGRGALVVTEAGRTIGRVRFGDSATPRAARALRAIGDAAPWPVGLISGRDEAATAALAGSLGVANFLGGLSTESKAGLLRTLRERGLNVAYVGDCRREPEVAREAGVAISVAGEFDPDRDPAPIVLLRGDLARIAGLRALAEAHVGRVRSVHGSAMIPNLVCIAGAFLFGFTSLATVIITNLGTLGVYARLPHRARGIEEPRHFPGPAPRRRRSIEAPRSAP